jgi:hypothetical protein
MKAMYPSMSPYCYAGNSPIAFKDPDGNYIVEVIKHENGQMELRITVVGYVEGKLADKLLEDFRLHYPNGYSAQGEYYDKNGTNWIISININMSESENFTEGGSTVDTDCKPRPGTVETADQGGSFVCAGAAGLALHGLWHNAGGDDCYRTTEGEGYICYNLGLNNNPKVRVEDFLQIGYHYLENIPNNVNAIPNVKKATVVETYTKGKEVKVGKPIKFTTDAQTAYFWSVYDSKEIDNIANNQFDRSVKNRSSIISPIRDLCPEGETKESSNVEYDKGHEVQL